MVETFSNIVFYFHMFILCRQNKIIEINKSADFVGFFSVYQVTKNQIRN